MISDLSEAMVRLMFWESNPGTSRIMLKQRMLPDLEGLAPTVASILKSFQAFSDQNADLYKDIHSLYRGRGTHVGEYVEQKDSHRALWRLLLLAL